MSSNITEWVKYELYPILFESIDRAFPEHNFKAFPGGWRSKTYLNGSPHSDRPDKTVVTKKAPGVILEQGGETLSLVDYVMRRDGVEFIQAVKTLADVAGLQLPQSTNFNPEEYKKYREEANILEEANSYFTYCLKESKYAQAILEYLQKRGYSSQEVIDMELGYIPDQAKLNNYLEGKGYTKQAIREALPIHKDTRIGTTHSLTIPYRSGGNIKGYKFRTITNTEPKYLNSSGLDRNSGFFNLLGIKGDKDVIIVEGELDSLHATVKGVDNVVATGGSSINSDQVKDAIKRGAKMFTLCFDYEKGKEEETFKKVNSAIQIILDEGVNRVYVAELPDTGNNKTDPDSLINTQGVNAFKEALSKALAYYEYQLNNTLEKYGKIEEEKGLEAKDIDWLLDEVVVMATGIKDPTDRDRYKKAFTSLDAVKELGITEESIAITIDRLAYNRDKESQERDFKKLLGDATQLQSKGEIDKAIELLSERVKEVKLQDKATEFNSLLLPVKEEEIRERQANKPESIRSGYTIGGEELLLPSGAISIFTAPTSHGKTTLLVNTALNVAKDYKDKEVYLFSYEEDRDSILMNSFNTYLDEDISQNNRRTINSYFTTGSTEYVRAPALDYFLAKKDEFFKDLIEPKRLNIHYSSYDSDTLIEAIRYLHKHANPGAIFIDYIQLLNLPQGKYKTYSRQEEIKEVCIALKDLAVETGLPIILGAQFNRTVVNHLQLHATKIGEAGDIERIANLIVGFWNNGFKIEGTEGEKAEIIKRGINEPGTIYAEILKNRGGRVGLEEVLDFNGSRAKIKNQVNSKPSNLFK